MYNDIDHRNPYVREELNYWAKWYYDTIEYEGVRLDAETPKSRFLQRMALYFKKNTGKISLL